MTEQQELPELIGTPRQIAQAKKIRLRILAELKEKMTALEVAVHEEYTPAQLDQVLPDIYTAIEKIKMQATARWWIANKNAKGRELFLMIRNIAFVIAIFREQISVEKVLNVP